MNLSSSARSLPGALVVLLLAVAPLHGAWAGDDAPTASPRKTQVNDAQALEQLLGEHDLSLQWISSSKLGKATVTDKDGLLKLEGEQRDSKGNYVRVDGIIERVDTKSFVFVGRVETRVKHILKGKACPREGRFLFRITGKRRYWRMKELTNPCDGVTDYVDVHLR